MIAYGMLLLLGMMFFPKGILSLFKRQAPKTARLVKERASDA